MAYITSRHQKGAKGVSKDDECEYVFVSTVCITTVLVCKCCVRHYGVDHWALMKMKCYVRVLGDVPREISSLCPSALDAEQNR